METGQEAIDFDFFDEDDKPQSSAASNRHGKNTGHDGQQQHDGGGMDSVRSTASSRSSLSFKIPTGGSNGKSARDNSYSSSDEDDEKSKRANGHVKSKQNKYDDDDDDSPAKDSSKDDDSPVGTRSNKSKSSRPKSSKSRRSPRKRHSSDSSSSHSSSSDYSSPSDSNSGSVTDVSPMQSPVNSRSPSPPRLQYSDDDVNHSTPVKGSRHKKHASKDSVRFKEPSPSGQVRPSSSKRAPNASSTKLDESEAHELSKLLRAVLELEETPLKSDFPGCEPRRQSSRPSSGRRPMSGKAMPHQRMNMSFSNDEVRRIDRENQLLLRNIMDQPTSVPNPEKRTKSARSRTRSYGASSAARPASGHISHSALLRQKEQRRIEIENMKFLQRLESAKPTNGLQRNTQVKDFLKQQQYSAQVAKAPRTRPLSGKRTDMAYSERGMSKASSMQSLQSDHSRVSSGSSRTTATRSRPSSAKYASETQHSSRPGWDEHWANY